MKNTLKAEKETHLETSLQNKTFLISYLNKTISEQEKKLVELDNMNKNLTVINEDIEKVQKTKVFQFSSLLNNLLNRFPQIKVLSKKIILIPVKITTSIVKFLYRLYPIKKHKRLLKEKVNSSNSLLTKLIKKVHYPQKENVMARVINKQEGEEYTISPITNFNKTIAVHLHLFYEDLLEEFYSYLSNIPFTFDLYISTNESANTGKIKRKFSKITSLNKIEIVKSINRGRDYGPMFVLFGKELSKYDYIYHIHSKKSQRTGHEQSEWRHNLLNPILGSCENIGLIFELMESRGIAQIFADSPTKDYSLWTHGWLGDARLASKILDSIKENPKVEDRYLDFSVGSMFVLKTESIRELLEKEWVWEDFEVEKGQDTGTTPHALERLITYYQTSKGYKFATFDDKNKIFQINYSSKNFADYKKITKESMLDTLSQYDIISFDIFDTLITRNIYYPDDVFLLVQERALNKGLLKKKAFVLLRKRAEENVRKKKKYLNDCTIEEIYEEFGKISKLSKSNTNEIKKLEINTELELIITRRDMLEIYNRLLAMNKIIILLSDMYLTKDIISKMLKKCGYDNYYDLIISSETGHRKDNGTMYEYVFSKYDTQSIIHVGDNESSDIHYLVRQGKPSSYVAQGRKLFGISDYALKAEPSLSLDDSLIWGRIINGSLFNSPFVKDDSTPVVEDFYQLGYSVLAPIFLYFFIWLFKKIDRNQTLLFISREGYYLEKIFQLFISRLNLEKDSYESLYFLGSRRALTVPNIKAFTDIERIMGSDYSTGTLYDLLYTRLGLRIKMTENKIVQLPRDKTLVIKFLKRYSEEILEGAKEEREAYLAYIMTLLPELKKKELAIVDLGYSGTAQFELSRLLNKKVGGYYFCVSRNLKPLSLGCKVETCFNNSIHEKNIEENLLFKNSLLFESFLTAPQGQLIRFNKIDGDAIPEFLPHNQKEEDLKMQEDTLKGITDFINEIIDIKGKDIFAMDIAKEPLLQNIVNYVNEIKRIYPNSPEIFTIEDTYCGRETLMILEKLA